MPRVVIDRYEIFDEIAKGGMATVFLGRLRGGSGFRRAVAIKRLHAHLAPDECARAATNHVDGDRVPVRG